MNWRLPSFDSFANSLRVPRHSKLTVETTTRKSSLHGDTSLLQKGQRSKLRVCFATVRKTFSAKIPVQKSLGFLGSQRSILTLPFIVQSRKVDYQTPSRLDVTR